MQEGAQIPLFCPSCKAEYRVGFTRCADCDIALVEEMPPDPSPEDLELVSVLETTDSSLLPVVRSVLDAAGIEYLVQGEEALGLLPFGRVGGVINPRALGAIIRVPRSRQEEARALIEGVSETDAE